MCSLAHFACSAAIVGIGGCSMSICFSCNEVAGAATMPLHGQQGRRWEWRQALPFRSIFIPSGLDKSTSRLRRRRARQLHQVPPAAAVVAVHRPTAVGPRRRRRRPREFEAVARGLRAGAGLAVFVEEVGFPGVVGGCGGGEGGG